MSESGLAPSTALACPGCGAEHPRAPGDWRCDCSELLELVRGLPRERPAFESRAERGVWRYAELVDPGASLSGIVTLREGDTPLLDSGLLSRWTGAPSLLLKHEGRNPTGSFKDRGMTVAVSEASRRGAGLLACASTGNTAASLAAYAARAELPAAVFVPAGATAREKLAQALAHGAHVFELEGDFDEGMRVALELARRGGLELVNSANPFRLEGQKTLVLEVLEAFGWDPPEWLVFPAGNLGNAAAFGKALREVKRAGWIERVPRLALVQASGAAPFAASYGAGFERLDPIRAETRATAIRIGAPVSFARAVRSVRETHGVVFTVSDEEIFAAKHVVDQAGIGAEPASCASVAGVRRLVEGVETPHGVMRIGAEERVVAVLTGHLFKDAAAILERAPAPLRVAARVEELTRALEALRSSRPGPSS